MVQSTHSSYGHGPINLGATLISTWGSEWHPSRAASVKWWNTHQAFRAGPGETQGSECAGAAIVTFLVSSLSLVPPPFLLLLPSLLPLFPSCF